MVTVMHRREQRLDQHIQPLEGTRLLESQDEILGR